MNLKKILTTLFYLSILVILFIGIGRQMMPQAQDTHPDLVKNIVLREASAEAHINFKHHTKPLFNENVTKTLEGLTSFYEAMSSSVSVVDINNDGWADFFAPSTELGTKSHLYINNKNGGFTESAESYGLSDLPNPVRAGFFDCDNDGIKEMLLTTVSCPILYKKNSDGIYKRFFNFSDSCTLTTAFNIFDFNRDGLLDIIIAPFSRTVPNNWHGSDNGPGSAMLFKNIGACRFEKNIDTLYESEKKFTHAIGVGDFRGNNTQDIWAATDFNLDRVFFEESTNNNHGENKKYTKQQSAEILSVTKAHNGMSVQSAYLFDNNTPSVYISQVYEPGFAIDGNQLWTYNNNDKQFNDSAKELGVHNCQWSWGSNFSDINNDGKLDLLVANGFISGDPEKNYWKKISRFALGSKKQLGLPWNWSSFKETSWSGHQQDCVFIGTDKGFVNIAKDLNFDHDHLDGRGIANIDTLNDGRISFLVANQKQDLRYYKNESTTGNNWIGFVLTGTKSNRDAIGANIWVELSDGSIQRRAYYPFNGYSAQSDSKISFGVAQNSVKSVKIKWPNGQEESYDFLKLNTYNTLIEANTN